MKRVVVLGNGDWRNLPNLSFKKDDYIIACDGAYDKAKRLHIKPNIIIGDLDSIRSKIDDPKIEVIQFPKEKDETDGELAFNHAFQKNPKEILWVAPFGNRWDYTIANLSLLMRSAKEEIPVILLQEDWDLYLVLSSLTIKGRKGDRVSLHPLSNQVTGIRTKGLRYPLNDENLYSESTRGLSNEMIRDKVSVTLKTGWLLLFHHAREGVLSH